ncbi:hypothetical protein NHQ30_000252 [Ciborinia camelliae]|nr:hypothetical protein NHQ30_000252 [Ciborinia camelliae]
MPEIVGGSLARSTILEMLWTVKKTIMPSQGRFWRYPKKAVSEESGMFIGSMFNRMHGRSQMLAKYLWYTRELQAPPLCEKLMRSSEKVECFVGSTPGTLSCSEPGMVASLKEFRRLL